MIGLIFGDTDFPNEILKTVKKRKIKYLIIDLSKSKKFKKNRKSYSVSIGQFGKILNILKENNCKKVLFAGKVNKPNFSKLKLDLKGIYYIQRIIKASKLGDAAILKEIIKILDQNKIKTENSLIYNPELSLKKYEYKKIMLKDGSIYFRILLGEFKSKTESLEFCKKIEFDYRKISLKHSSKSQ